MSFDPGFGPDGAVNNVVVQADGQILISGSFKNFNGVPRPGIARVKTDGSLDLTFDPGRGPSAAIHALRLQDDGEIIVGGEFASFAGSPLAGIARLHPDGSLDSGFDPGTGVFGGNLLIKTLTIQANGQIVIGGNFTGFDGLARTSLARLNSDGSLDEGFSPSIRGDSVGGAWISTIAVQRDGKILLAGRFTEVNGVARGNLARLNSNGTLDGEFAPDPGLMFVDMLLAMDNGAIYIGGGFSVVAGEPRLGVARLLANGRLDAAFVPRLRDRPEMAHLAVIPMKLQADERLIIGGIFRQWNSAWGPSVYGPIARLNPDGTEDVTFEAASALGDSYPSVQTMALQSDGNLIVGGRFDQPANLMRLHGGNTAAAPPMILVQSTNQSVTEGESASFSVWVRSYWPPTYQWQFNEENIPGATNPVLHLGNVQLSGAGNFRAIAHNPVGSVTSSVVSLVIMTARPDPGSVDITFNPESGPNNAVRAIARQPDGRVLIGGDFTRVAGLPRSQIARLNPDGSLDTSFDSA